MLCHAGPASAHAQPLLLLGACPTIATNASALCNATLFNFCRTGSGCRCSRHPVPHVERLQGAGCQGAARAGAFLLQPYRCTSMPGMANSFLNCEHHGFTLARCILMLYPSMSGLARRHVHQALCRSLRLFFVMVVSGSLTHAASNFDLGAISLALTFTSLHRDTAFRFFCRWTAHCTKRPCRKRSKPFLG